MTAEITLTAAQRAIIAAEGNLLVDAGAGSGKTTTVVQLLLHALGCTVGEGPDAIPGAEVPLSLDRLAAITFTNAAAADLKRKLRDALRAAGRPALATDVDAARIGTIHGFCGDLLRAYALRAGRAPTQRVLEDFEALQLGRDTARDVVHEAIERGPTPSLLALLGGRRLGNVIEWVATASDDEDRLERWSADADAAGLREHEEALLALARACLARRRERLAALGALDFDGMIVSARNLLRDADIRTAVQRRLKLLVIDEFQDVDPAQQEIAMLLAGPTRIVLVGDPKQSIYRFRRADVTLWDRSATAFRAGAGQVLPLHDNFRSSAPILGFVDHLIGALLDRPLSEDGRQAYEVAYTPLQPSVQPRGDDSGVELFVLPPGPKGSPQTANPVREAEVPAIAERLIELHHSGTAWSEMAILVPTWGSAAPLQSALTAAGVPCYVPRGKGFWEEREVLDCVLALRALRDAADETALLGFLKSPFVGVRDDTLLRVARAKAARARAGSGESLFDAVLATAADPELVESERALLLRASDLLTRYGALRDRLAAATLLERLLRETGYVAYLALREDGSQAIANVRKLIRLLDNARDASLGEFLREVREARERDDDVGPERLYGERGNVVTITTVHSAKGLEWDVVVLADLVHQLQDPTGEFLAGRESFAVREVSEDDDAGKDQRHETLKKAEGKEGLAERLRTWYVAATRAKQRLLLFTLALGESKRPASASAHFLTVLGELKPDEPYAYASRAGVRYEARVHRAGARPPRAEGRTALAPEFAMPPARRRAPIGAHRLSASQLMAFAKDPARWRRIYLQRVPMLDDDPDVRATGVGVQGAIVTGQVVHGVLERLVNDDVDLDALLEETIGRWDEEVAAAGLEGDLRWRRELRARVDAVASSAAWREVMALRGARRELEFTHLLPDGTAIVGALDLAGCGAEQAEIVDVKSSAASLSELARRYAVQASVYLGAVRAITGLAAARFRLVSATSGDSVEIEDAESVDRLVAALRAR